MIHHFLREELRNDADKPTLKAQLNDADKPTLKVQLSHLVSS